MYQIEENVPLPEEKAPGVLETLENLAVGQSVSIPIGRSRSFSSTISENYHATGTKKFTVRTKGQPQGTARVWRKA